MTKQRNPNQGTLFPELVFRHNYGGSEGGDVGHEFPFVQGLPPLPNEPNLALQATEPMIRLDSEPGVSVTL